MIKAIQISAVAAFLGCAAQAAPVQFAFTGVIDDSDIAGAQVGDTATMVAVFDNGGMSLENQVWNADDFLSVTFMAESGYSATASGVRMGTFGSASTDAFGALASLNIDPVDTSGTDTEGNTFFEFFMNTLNNVWYIADAAGSQTGESIGFTSPPNTDNVRISFVEAPAPIPLPATALLLLGAFGGLAALKRKSA